MNFKALILVLVFSFVFYCGCESTPANKTIQPASESEVFKIEDYLPAKVSILGLSEYVDDGENGSHIKVFVALLDKFVCQVKVGGVFRFELYERVLRSADPRGQRVEIWDDIDLRDAVVNNESWQDFLRAYQMELPFESKNGRDHILEVTFLSPTGERLTDILVLKVNK